MQKQIATSRSIGFHSMKQSRFFYDPLAATFDDPRQAAGERCFTTVGYSSRGRLFVVAHVERGGNIRIIQCQTIDTCKNNVPPGRFSCRVGQAQRTHRNSMILVCSPLAWLNPTYMEPLSRAVIIYTGINSMAIF